MKKQNVKNPLRKRILRELKGDWRKYLVVSLFLILTIGFVSGMYVANGSMMQSAAEGVKKYKLEDGHFETKKKLDTDTLAAIETGEKADVKQYYLDEAKKKLDEKFESKFKKEFTKEFDEEFEKKFEEQFGEGTKDQPMFVDAYKAAYDKAYDEAYDEAYDKAYDEAWKKAKDKVETKFKEAEDKYELNNPDFKAVTTKVYADFFRNETEDNDNDGKSDGTVRVYAKNEDINLACVIDGKLPESANEIAVDRMHADNVGMKVGDEITVGGEKFEIVGLIAYVNYSTLHEKNTDLIFDAIKFNVAMVTDEGFDRLGEAVHYAYSWKYDDEVADEIEEKKVSDDFLKALVTQLAVNDNELKDFVPGYANQAVHFATDDMGSDEAMGGVLLDILIVIIAFIFAITISNTIAKESSAIGTLRASGYTKAELVCHYISMPVIVTLISAIVGNILGYTVFKQVVVGMYYNSYSLPTYETIWNPGAFVKTTLIPVILMFVVNLIVIIRMMQHTPLQFLRHDLKKAKRKKAMRLPRWSFINRFRLRIIFQNIPNYLVLFAGIFFIMVMLAMAVGMPSTLDYYKKNATSMMLAKYQYILTDYKDDGDRIIETDNKDAEAFGMTSLQKKSDEITEEISVYGISDDSDYVKIKDLASQKENEVYISESFSDKYDLSVGDSVSLDEKYEKKQYTFKVAGIYDNSLSISVFMSLDNYRKVFDLEDDEFSGYMTNSKITDISKDEIATIITKRDITKMCDQLDHSMGSYMTYFQVLCILLSAVMIYLLTKIIIEKNENSISMTKILGYDNREIAGLYLFSTTIVMIIADILSVFLGALVMAQAWKIILFSYSGWFSFVIEPIGYVKMFAFVMIGYLIVLFFDFQRIKKIPMDQALKNVL